MSLETAVVGGSSHLLRLLKSLFTYYRSGDNFEISKYVVEPRDDGVEVEVEGGGRS